MDCITVLELVDWEGGVLSVWPHLLEAGITWQRNARAESRRSNMAGKPLKFKTPEELQHRIDAYFADKLEPKFTPDGAVYYEPITITGLALALDTTRETLMDYQERDEYSDTVKRAKLMVENYAEKMLFIGKSATGPIFALKNHGWRDQKDVIQETKLEAKHEHTGSVDVVTRIAELTA